MLNFQQLLFQSLVSRDPSEIILICRFAQETFLNVENICASFFCENHAAFSGLLDE